MRVTEARVQNYRCIADSGRFAVEKDKTILVGINEAGKTALLRAIQHASPAPDTPPLDYLYDAPAALVDDLRRGIKHAEDLPVAEVALKPEAPDLAGLALPSGSKDVTLVVTVYLDGHRTYRATGLPEMPRVASVRALLQSLASALSKTKRSAAQTVAVDIQKWLSTHGDHESIEGTAAQSLREGLARALAEAGEGSAAARHGDAIAELLAEADGLAKVTEHLRGKVPPFVYFSSYFAVRPRIHLNRLAEREETREIDMGYDFGNLQLLKYLGFTARELSDMESKAPEKNPNFDRDAQEQERYQKALVEHERQVHKRKVALQAAGRRLTAEVRQIWDDPSLTIRLDVDGQYLETTVEDDLGIPVGLDQRSEGFRWLVSFYVVFHAQAQDALKDAVLLLDEPGLSLHALKQQQFRHEVSKLAKGNQVLYTTHSPFMVGADELDLVRIVEMPDREIGTKVHTRLAVDDPDSIYPLQAALGYDLAQSMFTHQRNLVVEGVTDLLYVEALDKALGEFGGPTLRDSIAIVPAGSASKVVYYSTILVSQELKVAALLDSDAAGDQAAEQEALWQLLTKKRILRTGDHVATVKHAEIEDLLRGTLTTIARDICGWDSVATIEAQPERPIMEILAAEHPATKWKLARAFVRWLSENGAEALKDDERSAWNSLARAVNIALE